MLDLENLCFLSYLLFLWWVFSQMFFLFLQRVENGDFNWILPGKFSGSKHCISPSNLPAILTLVQVIVLHEFLVGKCILIN